MEIWHIRWIKNGEERSKPLTCIWKVSDFEKTLRKQGIDMPLIIIRVLL